MPARPSPREGFEGSLGAGLGARTSAEPALTYAEAIELTIRTIRVRGGSYRKLAVVVVVIFATSVGWATIAGSWWPLLGFLLVPPMFAVFVHADTVLVRRWRYTLVDSWADGSLDLQALQVALVGTSAIPKNTLREMLLTLPKVEAGGAVRRSSWATRHALALTIRCVDASAADRRAATTAALLAALGLAAWTLLAGSLRPLAGLLAVPIVFAVAIGTAGHRLGAWRGQVAALQRDGLDLKEFAQAVRQIDWRGIPSVQRDRFLDELV